MTLRQMDGRHPDSAWFFHRLQRIALISGLAASAASVAGLFLSSPAQFFRSYLVAFLFWGSISLGALAMAPAGFSIPKFLVPGSDFINRATFTWRKMRTLGCNSIRVILSPTAQSQSFRLNSTSASSGMPAKYRCVVARQGSRNQRA